jgi:MFS family permease
MIARKRSLLRDLFMINFLITLGFGVSDAFFPLYCESMGARGLLLGTAMGGYALSKVLFSPLMGTLADRLGRRPLVLSSIVLYLLVSFAYLTTASLFLVVGLRFLQGISCAMFRPVVQTLVADHAPADRRGKIMGTFDVSFYAALTVGPVLGGLIMDGWGFRGLFAALVLCCASALGLALFSMPVEPAKPWKSAEPAVRAGEGNRPRLRDIPLRGGTYKGLLVFILGRACGITACATFLPILLSYKLGLSGIKVGVVMASGTLAMTLLLRPAGKAADRVSRQAMVICGGTVVSFLYMLLPVAGGFIQVLGITLGIGAFSALSQPAVSALLAEEGQKLGMGTTIGTFNSFLNLGFVLGPILGALFQATVGLQGAFVAMGFIGLLTGTGFALRSTAA